MIGRLRALALLGALLATAAARAQPPVPPAPLSPSGPVTLLHLDAMASVEAPPDLLVGDLVAQASSRSAAAAQRQVDAMVAAGMKEARAIPGIDARATGYAVEPTDDKPPGWTARQTIELRGQDGPSLLDLVGRLQDRGFVTASLDWQLSDDARDRAHDAATARALARLQQRARDAAAALGLCVDHVDDVRLDDARAFSPRGPGPMLMAARLAAPPQATAAPQEVSAEASADVVLRPR